MRSGAKRCAELLAPLLTGKPIDIIVPIPTIESNIRVRGYDHMALITHYLGRLLGVPVKTLLATSSNQTQHHLTRKERLNNAKSRFTIVGLVDSSTSYLLVDDIVQG